MAKNDRLLLDQIISEVAKDNGFESGPAFQFFGISQVLKDFDLAPDEISLGIVDGRDDGGIDAWYTFLNGDLVFDETEIIPNRGPNKIEVFIFTAKHQDSFKQEPVVHLYATAPDLFDLSKEDSELQDRYNDALLANRNAFKNALVKTARGTATLTFRFIYLSRGESTAVGESIVARSNALLSECDKLFSDSTASFEYLGATELLAASRKLKDFSSVLRFEEGPVSRSGTNYVVLAKLSDYVRFVSDENGELRRYLFESNVRDYMGQTFVNTAIISTLSQGKSGDEQDFWWLNNGVTILASKATVIGKDLHLENVQIVNGLQTTESVHQYIKQSHQQNEDRCILVKILVTSQKELADAIILATNNQNKVDLASLHATEKIQRDIEDLLLTKNWFYDRRKNYYLNHGRPPSRIVSMTYMAWAIQALRLAESYECNRARPKSMQRQSEYKSIFSEHCDLQIYLAALEICKTTEAAIVSNKLSDDPYDVHNYATMFRFLYSYLYGVMTFGKRKFLDEDILELAKLRVPDDLLKKIHNFAINQRQVIRDRGQSDRKLHRNRSFQDALANQCIQDFKKT